MGRAVLALITRTKKCLLRTSSHCPQQPDGVKKRKRKTEGKHVIILYLGFSDTDKIQDLCSRDELMALMDLMVVSECLVFFEIMLYLCVL